MKKARGYKVKQFKTHKNLKNENGFLQPFLP